MKNILVTFFFTFQIITVIGQNTVGTIFINPEFSSKGYNLIFPHNQSTVFLINECGQIINKWEDEPQFRPGNAVYLLENGNLIKCKRANTSAVNDPIWAGGGGETVEVRSWDNQLLYSYTLNDSLFRLHHDVAPMPNGNILMILWEKKSYTEAVAVGRDTALLPQDELWSEAIWEWNPQLDSIVWKWSVWDHLIQDFDKQAQNFGSVKNNLQRIDINYDSQEGHPDWLHINSIDYNPVLDQILLSVPHFDEFWIINHDLSIEDARGTKGDILYRWGNPITYGQSATQKLFFQHHVQWLDSDASPESPNFGLVTLFNNRATNSSSSANIIQTPINPSTNTYQIAGGVFLPTDFKQVITHPTNYFKAFSNSVSSFQMLPNGNALICSGRWGYAYELSPKNKIVWEYVIPLKGGSPVAQGDTLSINNNLVFRMCRYGVDFPAFQGKNLTPQGFIEINPNLETCNELLSESKEYEETEVLIFPNPTDEYVNLITVEQKEIKVEVFNLLGVKIEEWSAQNHLSINTTGWEIGTYILRIDNKINRKIVVQK